MSERLWLCTRDVRKAWGVDTQTVGVVTAARGDRFGFYEVTRCAPLVRKTVMGLGEDLAVRILRSNGWTVEPVRASTGRDG